MAAPDSSGRLPSALRRAGGAPGLFAAALGRDRALQELRARGAALYRPFAPLMADVFAFFYEPGAVLAPAGPGCDKVQWLVLRYLFDAPEYAQLRGRTADRYMESLAAAEEVARWVIDYLVPGPLPPGRRAAQSGPAIAIEKLRLEEKASPGGGGDALAPMLVLAKRVQEAVETTQVLADVCNSWGLSPGKIRAMPWEQCAALAAKIGGTANLRRLAELVGRWSSLAGARRAARRPVVPEEVQSVTYGDDWPLFIPQEMAALAHPATRYDFYLRLIDRKIVQYDPESAASSGRGPILACLDTSGSMYGDRDLKSKAAALALYTVAKREGRPFAAVLFSSPDEWISFRFWGASAASRTPTGEEGMLTPLEGIIRTATFFFGGGTDYQSPLREAVRLIEQGGADWRDGDVVFVTDDYCEITREFAAEFSRAKAALKFRVFGVIVGAAAADARTLNEFSDRVLAAAEFDEDVAEQLFDAI